MTKLGITFHISFLIVLLILFVLMFGLPSWKKYQHVGISLEHSVAECDVLVPGIFHFFGGIGKNWYREKVSEPVSEKFGTGKKSRNRYRKNLVPEKGLGTGIGKIWYRS